MAAIGSIRKHGVLLMVIIGVALLAFLLSDLDQLVSSFSDRNTIVKMDGKELNDEYRVLYEQNTSLQRFLGQKTSLTETEVAQIHNITWEILLNEINTDKELAALGLSFSPEKIEEIKSNMLARISVESPRSEIDYFAQLLVSQGEPLESVVSFLTNIEEVRNVPGYEEFYNAYKAIERKEILNQKLNTYLTAANASVQLSTPLVQQFAADNKQAQVQFFSLNPNTPEFKDLKVEVSEQEMKDYYAKNSKKYNIKENMRDINVAIFPILPSVQDKQIIADSVNAQYARFEAATSLVEFNANESFNPVDSTYYSRARFAEIYQIDTLTKAFFDQPANTNVAPINYQDNVWIYGKSYSEVMRPDSIMVGYLIVDFKNDNNPNGTRTQEEATLLKDSLQNVLTTGVANIFQLTPQYLGGRDAADTTAWLIDGAVIPAVFDGLLNSTNGLYVFNHPSAYIIYQAITATQPVAKRQIAFYTKEIIPSDNTISATRAEANKLTSSVTSADGLVEYANQNGIQVINGTDITSIAASIQQLQNCRDLVKWSFNEEIEVDAISPVFEVNENMFVVGAVKNIKEKGEMKFEVAKAAIEAELVAKKKIETIANNLQAELKSTSMADAAVKHKVAMADSVNLTWGGNQYTNRNIESKAIGQIFTLNPNTPTAVSGNNMVYAINVMNITEPAPASANLQAETYALRDILIGRNRGAYSILQNLMDNTKTLDKRALVY